MGNKRPYQHQPGRGGHSSGDNFKAINGVSSVVESCLHRAGILTYAQFASLSPDDIITIVGNVSVLTPDRITKQNWIGQARELALRTSSAETAKETFKETSKETPKQTLAELPEDVVQNGEEQRREKFVVEIVLDDDELVTHTRVTHAQTGDLEKWDGWREERLVNFFTRQARIREVEAHPAEAQPVEARREETQPAEAQPAEARREETQPAEAQLEKVRLEVEEQQAAQAEAETSEPEISEPEPAQSDAASTEFVATETARAESESALRKEAAESPDSPVVEPVAEPVAAPVPEPEPVAAVQVAEPGAEPVAVQVAEPEPVAPVPVAVPVPEPVLAPVAVPVAKPAAKIGQRLWSSKLEVLTAASGAPSRLVRHDQPFDVRLNLDPASLTASGEELLVYNAVFNARSIGDEGIQTSLRVNGKIEQPGGSSIAIRGLYLQPGSYLLDASVTFSNPGKDQTKSGEFNVRAESSFLQVY